MQMNILLPFKLCFQLYGETKKSIYDLKYNKIAAKNEWFL